jgi:ornithine decarboxylase
MLHINIKSVALKSLHFNRFLPTTQGSFYTLSYERFIQQYVLWKKHLPKVHPYYAVKCNPDPILLQWMHNFGISFDCASAYEMSLVKKQFKTQSLKDHVLLANPCKTPNDILTGKMLNVPWVTADSKEELLKMHEADYRPNVLLRVAVDDSSSTCPFNVKFGLFEKDVEEVAYTAKQINMPITGLSFHVGSGSTSPKAFQLAVEMTQAIWESLQAKKYVGEFKTLDIGGGWSSDAETFEQQAHYAKEGLVKANPTTIIAEPGRFFAANTHDLYVKVVGKKPRAGGGWRYTIDESIYGQFSCIPFDHANPRIARVYFTEDDKVRPKTPATIFGRTCDSLDWICNSSEMDELEVGDWLYIPNMGAYTTATATEFNGFPKPQILESDQRPIESSLAWLDTISYPLASMLSVNKAA